MIIVLPYAQEDGRRILGSNGAAIVTLVGCGNRIAVEGNDYEKVLPTLPSVHVVHNRFLHGEVRARPYNVEDFRDALAAAGALPHFIVLGAYQNNHVWAVTLHNGEAAKKLKGCRCIVFDPEDQQVKLRLNLILYGVNDEDIRTAFTVFRNVTEVTWERWRVQSMCERGCTTKTVLFKL